jgi:hypothetical protein
MKIEIGFGLICPVRTVKHDSRLRHVDIGEYHMSQPEPV